VSIKRKSHNLDAGLLRRAQRALGTPTETETIHQALRAVVLGEQLVEGFESTTGRIEFRPGFVKEMHHERRRRREVRARYERVLPRARRP